MQLKGHHEGQEVCPEAPGTRVAGSLVALSLQRALFYSQRRLLLPGNCVSLFYI